MVSELSDQDNLESMLQEVDRLHQAALEHLSVRQRALEVANEAAEDFTPELDELDPSQRHVTVAGRGSGNTSDHQEIAKSEHLILNELEGGNSEPGA